MSGNSKTETKMAARKSLSAVRDSLLISYADNLLDDTEFLLLYDASYSRESYPYWKYDRFDLESWDDAQCKTEFRFSKNDLFILLDILEIPEVITCSQRTICDNIEGICILLKRLAFPCRYTDMVPYFGRNPTELCLIFNTVLDHIYNQHGQKLRTWNWPILAPPSLQRYADCVYQKGAPLQNCFGFIDGTVRRIARPQRNQRIVYNGHKRVHALKFQSVAIPNGIIANLSGPYEGKKHDSTMLNESGLLQQLQQVAWSNAQPLCLYGDPAYPVSLHLQSPFRNANLSQAQQDFNKGMSESRISVEWLFGLVSNYFKFIDFIKMQKIGLSPIGKMYIVCALLQNAHTCLYGNMISDYFNMDPPAIQEYFQ